MNKRFTYDKKTDTLVIKFGKAPIAESDEITAGVIVDYDGKGNAVSLEILNASKNAGGLLEKNGRRM
jgi:uncharacterized protein YuzE